jgi:protein TonB
MVSSYFDNPSVKNLIDKQLKHRNKELYEKLHDHTSYYHNNKGEKQREFVDYVFDFKKKKKTSDRDRKALIFNISLALSFAIVLAAFEWKSFQDNSLVTLGDDFVDTEEIMDVPVTEQPPPPPPKKIIQAANIVEIPDEEEIKQDIEVDFDLEVSEEDKIEVVDFPEVEMEEEVADEIFVIVEDQPNPEGGMSAFYGYVADNLRYPSVARRMGVQGKVFVQFVIEKDGSITQVQVVKGIGAGCDEEAARVVAQCSIPWSPGKQRGKPVRTRMIIPIHFTLVAQ